MARMVCKIFYETDYRIEVQIGVRFHGSAGITQESST
jgi:hypothetical protein